MIIFLKSFLPTLNRFVSVWWVQFTYIHVRCTQTQTQHNYRHHHKSPALILMTMPANLALMTMIFFYPALLSVGQIFVLCTDLTRASSAKSQSLSHCANRGIKSENRQLFLVGVWLGLCIWDVCTGASLKNIFEGRYSVKSNY